MEILEILNQLEDNSISISLDGTDLEINFMQDEIPDEVITLLRENKKLLVSYLSKLQGAEAFEEIPKAEIQECYPLSSAQMRLWMLSQFDGVSLAYNMPSSFDLDGDFDTAYLNKAIQAVIERHEILRTIFKLDANGEIKQWVIPYEAFEFECQFHNLCDSPNARELAQEIINKDCYEYFDFENGPLLRVAFFQIEKEKYIFYYNMHHVITDSWSINILSRDILAYYKHFKDEEKLELPELQIQYKDYATWQLDKLKSTTFEKHKTYWLDKLSGDLPKLDLPITKQRPLLKTSNGRLLRSYIRNKDIGLIRNYIKENGGTLFTFLSATLKVLFHKYTGQKDIIVGSPIAGRKHAYLEDQIGFYVNTLALRSEIDSSLSFDDFYQQVNQDLLDAYTHQMYPFDQLVEDLNVQRDTSRSPVFDVMVVLQNTGNSRGEGFVLDEDKPAVEDFGETMALFDLIFNFYEGEDHLLIELTYNTDLYGYDRMVSFLSHYLQIVREIITESNAAIGTLEYLTTPERNQVLYEFNNTATPYPKDKTILGLFEDQVVNNPDNIAVFFEDKKLTFSELNECANQFANYLKNQYEVASDNLIGIMLGRSEWAIVSMLAVLKTGAAYVPIDPNYPQERIDHMISDSQCKLLIDQKELNLFIKDREKYDGNNLNSLIEPTDLAYVIYTSGSTGKAKGVAIKHSGIANTILSLIDICKLERCTNSLQFSSFSFDASILEIYVILLSGRSLYVLSDEVRNDVDLFEKYIVEHKIDFAFIPPAFLKLVNIQHFKDLKVLATGGEAAVYDKVLEYLKYDGIFVNAYGPTEISICATAFEIENNSQLKDTNIPIGKPLANTQVYILDEFLKPCAIGIPGELYISGSGLMRGYLNRPDLTSKGLVTNPFKKGELMYKSGDVVKWLEEGDIVFLGRADDQVKIRGYRIELGEIEKTISEYTTAINQIIVMAQEVKGEKELAAYFTASEEIVLADFRSYLQSRLPAYMVPAYFIPLDAFPLAPNGKIDKKALPNPEDLNLSSETEYVAPETETEKQLVAVWESVLEKSPIGIKDNFFALGGHSIKAIQLVNECHKVFDVKLSITEIFSNPLFSTHVDLINDMQWNDQTLNSAEVVDKITI